MVSHEAEQEIPKVIKDKVNNNFSFLSIMDFIKTWNDRCERLEISNISIVDYYLPNHGKELSTVEEDYIFTEVLRDVIGNQEFINEVNNKWKLRNIHKPGYVCNAIKDVDNYRIEAYRETRDKGAGEYTLRSYVMLKNDHDRVGENVQRVDLINKMLSHEGMMVIQGRGHPLYMILRMINASRN